MRRLFPLTALLAVLVLGLALAGCGGGGSKSGGSGGAGSPTALTRTPFLGVSPGLPLLASPALFARETPVMARSGVSTLRVPFYWSSLEPAKGKPRLARTDAIVAAAAKAKLDVLAVVVGTPT